MRYFRIIFYTEGGEYETREKLVDEPTFRNVQKLIGSGGGNLMFDNLMIKTSAIKEMLPADDIVGEYLATGTTLKQLGLPEMKKLDNKETPKLKDRYGEIKKI